MTSIPPSLSLSNKVAIVTGASRGIGAGIAIELANRGAKVALVYRNDSSTPLAGKIAAQIQHLGSQATLIQADLESLECGRVVVNKTLEGLGVKYIDILVNNAAVDPPLHTTVDFDPEFFEKYAVFPHFPLYQVRTSFPLKKKKFHFTKKISPFPTKPPPSPRKKLTSPFPFQNDKHKRPRPPPPRPSPNPSSPSFFLPHHQHVSSPLHLSTLLVPI